MKKILSIMLGMSFMLGTLAFAQDASSGTAGTTDTSTKKAKKNKKSKKNKSGDKMNGSSTDTTTAAPK
jgi:Ni/Co efflux regulator RcnB